MRFVSLLGDLPPLLSVAINEAKFQILRPDIQNALMEACDRAGDFFSQHVRESDAQNEALNIARFKAAYLKVALDPWRLAVSRARSQLLDEGLLDSETMAAVDAALVYPTGGEAAP
jgi:TRAP-type C4-dicarboxylate transport system substrate-binding protein